MILPLFGFCTVTFLLLFSLLCNRAKRRSLPRCRRALLVIAHPDDETMFFTPTLHGLRLSGSNIYLLCISTGNSNGLGVIRKYELASAFTVHGLSLDNLTVLDYDNFQDGFIQWSKEELAKVILRHIQMLDVDLVITFDEGGVSAHPNHIGCFRALQYLYTIGLIPAGVQIFVLESVSIWRKYMIFLDALISSFHSTFLYISSPLLYITAWRAMWAHRSQLVWFRYLYMLFSRYVLINTLKRIHAQPRHPILKKKLRLHC
ncbi:GlcNAc-PI de-N-acetylase family protein [Acanthocheilonema viteae]|uniref:N-acetylglucosaminylphosphatidylinositol deacetylase n=1 Tax=Acanthocheilonema viteae TaxID=6277 RepID=A0A498S6K5_ACAVI|nr:unnamed protein product [Acanthocheilonema viteae]